MTDEMNVTGTTGSGDVAEKVNEATDAVAADVQSKMSAAGETAANVASEMKEFGVRIVAVAQAAINTPEAQDLRDDLIDGVRQLREQFDGLLENLRARRGAEGGESSATPAAAKLAAQLRVEAAQILRGVNRGLDKLAGTIEPSRAVDTAAAGDEGATTSS